jgi:hypothetical protein
MGKKKIGETTLRAHENGWNIMEGTLCYSVTDCDASLYKAPIFTHNHTLGNNAIIGGFVYRGTGLAGLQEKYLFGDYGSGRIWEFTLSNSTVKVVELVNTGLPITAFGLGEEGEIYVCTLGGDIFTIAN